MFYSGMVGVIWKDDIIGVLENNFKKVSFFECFYLCIYFFFYLELRWVKILFVICNIVIVVWKVMIKLLNVLIIFC